MSRPSHSLGPLGLGQGCPDKVSLYRTDASEEADGRVSDSRFYKKKYLAGQPGFRYKQRHDGRSGGAADLVLRRIHKVQQGLSSDCS